MNSVPSDPSVSPVVTQCHGLSELREPWDGPGSAADGPDCCAVRIQCRSSADPARIHRPARCPFPSHRSSPHRRRCRAPRYAELTEPTRSFCPAQRAGPAQRTRASAGAAGPRPRAHLHCGSATDTERLRMKCKVPFPVFTAPNMKNNNVQ